MSNTKKVLIVVFSLTVGLIVIIGVFSSIGMTNYKEFDEKSRAKEAYALVGGIYQAAHASSAEYARFPKDCIEAGFTMSGITGSKLLYRKTENGFEASAQANKSRTIVWIDHEKNTKEVAEHIKGDGVVDCRQGVN